MYHAGLEHALTEMACDWSKCVGHDLHFLKPEYRAKEKCRSLVFI